MLQTHFTLKMCSLANAEQFDSAFSVELTCIVRWKKKHEMKWKVFAMTHESWRALTILYSTKCRIIPIPCALCLIELEYIFAETKTLREMNIKRMIADRIDILAVGRIKLCIARQPSYRCICLDTFHWYCSCISFFLSQNSLMLCAFPEFDSMHILKFILFDSIEWCSLWFHPIPQIHPIHYLHMKWLTFQHSLKPTKKPT